MTGSTSTLLEVFGLTLRPAREALVSGFSLTVERGTLHAIVGPNGAGKTTLLSAILGLIPFEGRIVAHWAGRGRMAYVPQQFQIDRTLPVTVADFLALTRQKFPVCLGVTSATRKRISLLLDRVNLRGIEKRPLSVLSGGELRRVLLANALDPEQGDRDLGGGQAAVQRERLTGDVGRCGACKIDRGRADLLRCGEASGRYALEHAVPEFRIGIEVRST